MMITAEVSDAIHGGPAARISAELDVFVTGHGWHEVGHGVTNKEGHILEFGEPAAPGVYRLMFDVGTYWQETCFPSITVTFEVRDPAQACHLRVAAGPFGYTVYRR